MPEHDQLHPVARRIRRFVDQRLLPLEPCLDAGDARAEDCLAQLQQAARDAGLWGQANGLAPGRLLDYLRRTDVERYRALIARLGLRR